MAMPAAEIEALIKAALPDAEVEIEALVEVDGAYISVDHADVWARVRIERGFEATQHRTRCIHADDAMPHPREMQRYASAAHGQLE